MLKRIALMLLVSLTGCATYQPPTLPPEQLSTLSFEQKPAWIGSAGSVALERIDGQSPDNASWILRHRGPITVAPGKHTIRLHYVVHTYSGETELWFVAEPGISYVVRGESGRDREGVKFVLWVEEEKTGKRVGGIAGSVDEPK